MATMDDHGDMATIELAIAMMADIPDMATIDMATMNDHGDMATIELAIAMMVDIPDVATIDLTIAPTMVQESRRRKTTPASYRGNRL